MRKTLALPRMHKRVARSIHPYAPLLFVVVLATLWGVAYRFLGFAILHAERVVLQAQHAPVRVVVGISTFGQRVFHMGPTLQNVLSQTRKADRIIVSIPVTYRDASTEKTSCPEWDDCESDPNLFDESKEGILDWFKKQTAASHINQTNRNTYEFPGQLTILFLDTDWGAGSKALGALTLEHDPDTIIITLDDDMIYNGQTLEWLAAHSAPHMALGVGCETWDIFRRDFVGYSPSHSLATFLSPSPRVCNGWLSGWSAVAYRVAHFGPDIWGFLETLPRGCFFNDDIWLSGYLARKGIPRVYVPGVLPHGPHRRDKTLSLSTIEDTREKYGYPCARELFE